MIDDEMVKAFAAEIDEIVAAHEKSTHHQQRRTMIDEEVVDGGLLVDDERQIDQKTGIITRQLTMEERHRLTKAELDRCGQAIDLLRVPCWVAEENGKIIGCMAARVVFEVIAHPVQSPEGVPMLPTGHAERLLLETCHRWMRSNKAKAGTHIANGVGSHFAIYKSPAESTSELLRRLGWKLVDFASSTIFARTF